MRGICEFCGGKARTGRAITCNAPECRDKRNRKGKEVCLKNQKRRRAEAKALARENRPLCLRCDKPFKSTGKHNRICGACKKYRAEKMAGPVDWLGVI